MIDLLAPYAKELQEISGEPTETALRRAAGFLARLTADPALLAAEVLPHAREVGEAGGRDYDPSRDHVCGRSV